LITLDRENVIDFDALLKSLCIPLNEQFEKSFNQITFTCNYQLRLIAETLN